MKAPHRALRFDDISGQKFGRLTAVWPAGRKNRAVIWFCVCDCGGMTHIRKADLCRGHNVGCGCRVAESQFKPTHGMTHTSEWNSYSDAKNRCTNFKHHAWKDYGGRGIKFLFKSFEEFYTELGPRPPKLQLDRINNNGHYEKGNVRWATVKQQANNRRNPWASGGGRRCQIPA